MCSDAQILQLLVFLSDLAVLLFSIVSMYTVRQK